MGKKIIKSFIERAPLILILLSIGAIIFGGIGLSRWDYSIRGLAVAIPMIISAIFLKYLISAREDPFNNDGIHLANNFISPKTFFIIYIVSCLFLLLKLPREMYFAIIIGLFLILTIQIVFINYNIYSILSGIMLTMINIIYGVTLYYPFYFSTTDISRHIYWAKVTLLSGHVIPLDLDPGYSAFPLYHIFIAECSNIFNLPIQQTLFLVTGPLFVLIVLFLYSIFYYFSENTQVALLGCVFFSLYEVVYAKGIEMVTSPTAFVGYCMLIYAMLKIGGRHDQRFIFQSISLVFSLFIILVHQVSIFLIVALLVIFILSEILVGKNKIFANYFILFIISVLFGYWSYSASTFFNQVLTPRLNPNVFSFADSPSVMSAPIIDRNMVAFISLYDKIDISILITFAITGVIFMIWRQKPKYLAVLGIFLLFTLPLYLPNPFTTYSIFSDLFRLDRFLILMSPFMTFAMAYGFVLTYKFFNGRFKSKSVLSCICISIVGIFIVTSLSGVILSDPGDRRYFDTQEIEGFSFVFNNISYGLDLKSDYFTVRFFPYKYFSLTDALHLPHYNIQLLKGFDKPADGNGYSIVREKTFEEGGLYIEPTSGLYLYRPDLQNRLEMRKFISEKNKVYYNSHVTIVN